MAADVEAVYVASPVQYHAEQISAALLAGKHVLAEKPLCRNALEARQVVTLAQQGGLKLGCGLMMRFSRQHQAALRLIEEGRLGQPVYGRAQMMCWYPPMAGAWRQETSLGGGGALMDMGGHCIDLLEPIIQHSVPSGSWTIMPSPIVKNALVSHMYSLLPELHRTIRHESEQAYGTSHQ